jgi:hypothetical protein
MITTVRENLLQKLTELSRLYPEMRFGQLMVMVSSFAGKKEPAFMNEVDDDAAMEAIERHLARTRLHPEPVASVPDVRAALIMELENVGERHREWALGTLVFNLATHAGVNEYDIEDEGLLLAARSSS